MSVTGTHRSPPTCRDTVAALGEYVDAELPAAQFASVTDHLESCPACATYLGNYRAVDHLVRWAFAAS